MVITSWLSALSSKFFGKKTPLRMRSQQSKPPVPASHATEVLETRTLMTVNALTDVYDTGIDEDLFGDNYPSALATIRIPGGGAAFFFLPGGGQNGRRP